MYEIMDDKASSVVIYFHSQMGCDTSGRFNRISKGTRTKVFVNRISDAHMINDTALYTVENLDHQYLKQAEVF